MEPTRVIGEFSAQLGPLVAPVQLGQRLQVVIMGHAPYVESVYEAVKDVLPITSYEIQHANHPVKDSRGRHVGRQIITRFILTLEVPPDA